MHNPFQSRFYAHVISRSSFASFPSGLGGGKRSEERYFFACFDAFVLASARRSVFLRRAARFLTLSLPWLFPIRASPSPLREWFQVISPNHPPGRRQKGVQHRRFASSKKLHQRVSRFLWLFLQDPMTRVLEHDHGHVIRDKLHLLTERAA